MGTDTLERASDSMEIYIGGIIGVANAREEEVRSLIGKLRGKLPEKYLKEPSIYRNVRRLEILAKLPTLYYEPIKQKAVLLRSAVASYEVQLSN